VISHAIGGNRNVEVVRDVIDPINPDGIIGRWQIALRYGEVQVDVLCPDSIVLKEAYGRLQVFCLIIGSWQSVALILFGEVKSEVVVDQRLVFVVVHGIVVAPF